MQNEIMDVHKTISDFMYEYLGKTGTNLLDFAINLLIAFLILIIGFKLIKTLEKLCRKIFDNSNMDPTLESFLLSFIRLGAKVIVIFCAINKIGVATSSIIAILGSAGLALGLSLQGSLANIAGGVILLLMKPFKVGDYIVESSGKEGTVQAIGIMYTKLLTVDNKAIMIPNGSLSNATVTNVTFQDKRRVDLLIGISYDDDIRKAKKVLEELVLQEECLMEGEPIQIFVNDYKDSCVELGVRYWVKTGDYWTSRWRVLEEIKYAFDKNQISIPFNQLDVTVKKM